MRIGLVGRGDVPERVKIAKDAASHLDGRAEVVASPPLAAQLDVPGERVEQMDVDAIVTVGGDGSILYSVQRNPAPVCGINMGRMGFLTSAEPEDLSNALDDLLDGAYTLEERMQIECRLDGELLPSAVNEIVFKSPDPSNVLDVDVEIDESEPLSLRSDGVIISTPTGSTAYSVSSGGPFVHPDAKCLLVVPLADFNLSSRPLVVPPEHAIELRLQEGSADAVFAIDGQYTTPFQPGNTMTIRRSDTPARLIRFGRDFYERLNQQFLDP